MALCTEERESTLTMAKRWVSTLEGEHYIIPAPEFTRVQLRNIAAAIVLIAEHANYDDGEGNKDASVLRGRLSCIRDILDGA